MLNLEDLEKLKKRVEGFEEPVLSVYLNTNPADPENRNKAYVIRLKDALKELEASKKLAEAVLQHVEGRQRLSRTLVLFASQQDGMETLLLQVKFSMRLLPLL